MAVRSEVAISTIQARFTASCELFSLATTSKYVVVVLLVEATPTWKYNLGTSWWSIDSIRFEHRVSRKKGRALVDFPSFPGLRGPTLDFSASKSSMSFSFLFRTASIQPKSMSRNALKKSRATYILLIARSVDLEPIVALSIQRRLTTDRVLEK